MTSDSTYNSLLKVKNDILSQIEELNRDVEAINRLLDRRIPLNGSSETSKINHFDSSDGKKSELYVPSFKEAKTWKQKFYFILNEIGGGYVTDAANKLVEHDSSISIDEAKKKATLYLSILYNDGELRADKSGRSYKYQIKK